MENKMETRSNRRLITVREMEPGMILTGIELSGGQIARMGRHQITKIDGPNIWGEYLFNGATLKFTPDTSARYEIEVN